VRDVVLDASAILAIVFGGAGEKRALALVEGARVSAVSLSEAVARMDELGFDPDEAEMLLDGLGITVVEFGRREAYGAGRLGRAAGLSAGDRACLALAMREGLGVVTAEQAWEGLGLPVEVEVIG
jgi:PIN domain nuclease of toxin-antitoxin system